MDTGSWTLAAMRYPDGRGATLCPRGMGIGIGMAMRRVMRRVMRIVTMMRTMTRTMNRASAEEINGLKDGLVLRGNMSGVIIHGKKEKGVENGTVECLNLVCGTILGGWYCTCLAWS